MDEGAAKTLLDLRDLKLRSLELHTGASATRVLLPRAAGATTVRAETGAAELVLEIPAGVAAWISIFTVLRSTHIDEARFPPAGGGHESPWTARRRRTGWTSTSRRCGLIAGGHGTLSMGAEAI